MAPGPTQFNVVTGAFGYTGKYITRRLLSMGESVRTLTRHPVRPSPFGDQVRVFPFNFDRPVDLTESLRGAATLYNTYWIRFARGKRSYDGAVENTKRLLEAARAAGVWRVVHLSITNAAKDSPFPYFRGKALLEEAVIQSGLSYAIIRPTLIFGAEDILVNNIAWFLRRFPLFPVSGAGNCAVQPVYVEDVAELAVAAAHQHEDSILDAVGPEVYIFNDLVRLIATKVLSRAKIVHVPPGVVLFLSRLVGYILRDVVLTEDEMHSLMAGLLVSSGPPTAGTHLSRWLEDNRHILGVMYASELRRHFG